MYIVSVERSPNSNQYAIMILESTVFRKSHWAGLFTWLVLLGTATPAFAKVDDILFNDSLHVEHEAQTFTLKLTGHAKRKIMFFPIYSVAHYVAPQNIIAPDGDLYDAILSADGPKQISIVFDRDLDAEKVQKTLTKGVNKNCVGDEFDQVSEALAEFKQQINQDVKRNDLFVLRWLPDGRLQSIYHDEVVGEVTSPLLSRLLWSIWFGEHAVVDRKKMVTNIAHLAQRN